MRFPRFVKKKCKKCGNDGLWVCAYIIGENEAIPTFMCMNRSCEAVYDVNEYGKVWF